MSEERRKKEHFGRERNCERSPCERATAWESGVAVNGCAGLWWEE